MLESPSAVFLQQYKPLSRVLLLLRSRWRSKCTFSDHSTLHEGSVNIAVRFCHELWGEQGLETARTTYCWGSECLCLDDDEDVAAISDTVASDWDWVSATYAQNAIRKYRRISQTKIIGKSPCMLPCAWLYVVLINKFPIRGWQRRVRLLFSKSAMLYQRLSPLLYRQYLGIV